MKIDLDKIMFKLDAFLIGTAFGLLLAIIVKIIQG